MISLHLHGFSSFLIQSKDKHVKFIRDSKLAAGNNMSMCVSVIDRGPVQGHFNLALKIVLMMLDHNVLTILLLFFFFLISK